MSFAFTAHLLLGTKVGDMMSRAQAWKEVVDKVKNRLSKWKMKALSIGGRLTLLKSVRWLFSIFSYGPFFSSFNSCIVTKCLESLRGHFLRHGIVVIKLERHGLRRDKGFKLAKDKVQNVVVWFNSSLWLPMEDPGGSANLEGSGESLFAANDGG
ncbi:hypothetical protein Tco_1405620 [Tanacetum coccineum]